MPTPLENYIQQRTEEFEKYCIEFPNAEVGVVFPSIQKFSTETTTHLIEMMRELVEKFAAQSYEKGVRNLNIHDAEIEVEAFKKVLSVLPNQKQS